MCLHEVASCCIECLFNAAEKTGNKLRGDKILVHFNTLLMCKLTAISTLFLLLFMRLFCAWVSRFHQVKMVNKRGVSIDFFGVILVALYTSFHANSLQLRLDQFQLGNSWRLEGGNIPIGMLSLQFTPAFFCRAAYRIFLRHSLSCAVHIFDSHFVVIVSCSVRENRCHSNVPASLTTCHFIECTKYAIVIRVGMTSSRAQSHSAPVDIVSPRK